MDVLKIDLELIKQEHWSDQEKANVGLIADFIQHLMNDHDFDYILENYNHSAYVQHNRNIGDGIEALVNAVKDFAKMFPDYTYDVKHVFADGEFVIFHSHATRKKAHRGDDSKGLNIIDTWRVQAGSISDHWDSVQPLDAMMRLYVLFTGGKIKNTNGVF